LYYTTGTFAGTTTVFNNSGTVGAAGTASVLNAGWTSATVAMPYSALQLSALTNTNALTSTVPVSGRMVSVGMRVQYTGTALNESGLFYCYHDPAHASLSGVSPSNIGAFGDACIEAVRRDPCTLSVFPVNSNEFEFAGQSPLTNTAGEILSINYPYSQGTYLWDATYGSATALTAVTLAASTGTYGLYVGAPVGVIAITGVAGQTVHLEVIQHAEYAGVGAAASLTTTHSDIEGAQLVRTAALEVPQMKLNDPGRTPWSYMSAALTGAWNAVKPVALPVLERALVALLI